MPSRTLSPSALEERHHRQHHDTDRLMQEFSVSSNGFLPETLPLARLPEPYFAPWEQVLDRLPQLIQNGTVREVLDRLEVLSVQSLSSEPEWRRAYVVLTFFTHAYIWGGAVAAEVLPPAVSIPLLKVCAYLKQPPVATYASLNLWNFTTVSAPLSLPSPSLSVAQPAFSSSSSSTTNSSVSLPSSTSLNINVKIENENNNDPLDFTNLDRLRSLHTFTGTEDESWFYCVSVAMEARGGRDAMPLILQALEAADVLRASRLYSSPSPSSSSTTTRKGAATEADTLKAIKTLTTSLNSLSEVIADLGLLLERMYERCRPDVFYHQIRPMLAGSKNMGAAGLPRGVFYFEDSDEDSADSTDSSDSEKEVGGDEEQQTWDGTQRTGSWHQYRGGSNGQSSLLQAFDVLLGVEHGGPATPRSSSSTATTASSNSISSTSSSSPTSSTSPVLSSPWADPKSSQKKEDEPELSFHNEVRAYMPLGHRTFLQHIRDLGSMRDLVSGLLLQQSNLQQAAEKTATTTEAGVEAVAEAAAAVSVADQEMVRGVNNAFRNATEALGELRSRHMRMVSRYIIVPSRKPAPGSGAATATTTTTTTADGIAGKKVVNLASVSQEKDQAGEKEEDRLTGTGGTPLIPFLKKTRDETFAAGRLG